MVVRKSDGSGVEDLNGLGEGGGDVGLGGVAGKSLKPGEAKGGVYFGKSCAHVTLFMLCR